MATRKSMENFFDRCEMALEYASNQLTEAARQEHYNDLEFTKAQAELENVTNDLARLALSANPQQREQLHRMRLQLQHKQNEMILRDE